MAVFTRQLPAVTIRYGTTERTIPSGWMINARDSNNVTGTPKKLQLKNGALSLTRSKLRAFRVTRHPAGSIGGNGMVTAPKDAASSVSDSKSSPPVSVHDGVFALTAQETTAYRSYADNRAYQHFYRGKRGLLSESSSLGVTLGSWKQSQDMIVKRSRDVLNVTTKAAAALEADKHYRRRLRKKLQASGATGREILADDFLEMKFGWVPFFEDIHSALAVVCEDYSDKRVFHTARGKVKYSRQSLTKGALQTLQFAIESEFITSYNAMVKIQNQNLWMLNKLGLVNPALVALDLIPWSFVVGMFTNQNAFVSQVTDRVGLSISDEAITRTARSSVYRYASDNRKSYGSYVYEASEAWYTYYSKSRILQTPLAVSFETKVPKLDWNLAVTAMALVEQKFRVLNKLANAIGKA